MVNILRVLGIASIPILAYMPSVHIYSIIYFDLIFSRFVFTSLLLMRLL
jgi:hypothetical protein